LPAAKRYLRIVSHCQAHVAESCRWLIEEHDTEAGEQQVKAARLEYMSSRIGL
jgi:hypothetical protein